MNALPLFETDLDNDVPFEPVVEAADPVCCWCWLPIETDADRETGAHHHCLADMQVYVR